MSNDMKLFDGATERLAGPNKAKRKRELTPEEMELNEAEDVLALILNRKAPPEGWKYEQLTEETAVLKYGMDRRYDLRMLNGNMILQQEYDRVMETRNARAKVRELEEAAGALASISSYLSSASWTERLEGFNGGPEFLIPGWLPRGILTSFYGRDGIGKSFLAMHMLVSIAIGRCPFRSKPKCKPLKVLFISAEDPEAEILKRLKAILEDLKLTKRERRLLEENFSMPNMISADVRLVHFDRNLRSQRMSMTESKFTRELRKRIKENKPDVLCLDPISDIFGDNENERNKVAEFLRMLNQIADQHQIAIILVGHPSRAEESEYSGSGAWSSKVRSRWLFKREDDQLPELLCRKHSWWEEPVEPLGVVTKGVIRPMSAIETRDQNAAYAEEIDDALCRIIRDETKVTTQPQAAKGIYALARDEGLPYCVAEITASINRMKREGRIVQIETKAHNGNSVRELELV